ncbi:MAG: biopolymer transporter ExbD [Magnetococcales bacterium]|nr:biopolymer transporter ExbD [Magnetococcales bacterium]
MQFRNRPQRDVTLDITPLLDVMFLLVLFFLVTTTFSNGGIGLKLPEAQTGQHQPIMDRLVISVDQYGRFHFNNQVVNRSRLEKELMNFVRGHPSGTLLVQAHETARHGDVVKVFDFARQAGISRLMIATRPADLTESN